VYIDPYFIYGRRSHVPDSMVKDGVAYRIVTDAIGSVRLVINAQSGEIAQRIDYDPFGRVLRDSSPGFQPFGFAGGVPDSATGLVRMGVRDYDPETGRFTSKDPLFFAGGSTNLYEYSGSDPINRTDPSGLYGGTVEVSFGWIQLGLTYQSEVGLSGSVQVGIGAPGVSVSGSGTPFVPVNASEGFLSRDAKLTLEGKVSASFGDLGGASVGIKSEELKDKYGYYCGEFSRPALKEEFCLLGTCVDLSSDEPKADLGKAKNIVQKKAETKFDAGVEAAAKLEFLIFR
ncbi:MAG: RHS repeat domain-containing protein, partial [Vicinamibacterales bacterium]